MSGAGDDEFDDEETCVEEDDVYNQLGDPGIVAEMLQQHEDSIHEEAVKLVQFKEAVKKDVELPKLRDELQKCVSELPDGSVEAVEAALKRYKDQKQRIKNAIYK